VRVSCGTLGEEDDIYLRSFTEDGVGD